MVDSLNQMFRDLDIPQDGQKYLLNSPALEQIRLLSDFNFNPFVAKYANWSLLSLRFVFNPENH